MTDIDPIEERLRRTFRAVAEQRISPAGTGDEPWHDSAPSPPPRRQHRVLLGALALVVLAAVGLVVVYGPRSSTNSPGPVPVTQSSQVLHAVFVPASPQPRDRLEQAASTMRARLASLGDRSARVTVDSNAIDVSGRKLDASEVRLVGERGEFLVRPVLCGAPPYSPPPQGGALPSGPLPVCGSPYATTAANLAVNTTTGQPANTILPDPEFATYQSNSPEADDPSTSVLVPGNPATGAQQYPRFVLGPADLSSSDIASADAQFENSTDSWFVDAQLKPNAVVRWNAIAALSFHAYVSFELDGQVLSAPLIEPTGTTFAQFGGELQMTGNYSAAEAKGLAALIGSGPMPVEFRLESLTR